MTISRRNKRKITVDENVFYWVYKFQDDSLRLTVMTDKKSNSRLICDFDYRKLESYFRELVKDDDSYADKFLIISPGVLTPYVIKQTIDLALKADWKPFEQGSDFLLKDIENKIDINFWTESTAEERKSKI